MKMPNRIWLWRWMHRIAHLVINQRSCIEHLHVNLWIMVRFYEVRSPKMRTTKLVDRLHSMDLLWKRRKREKRRKEKKRKRYCFRSMSVDFFFITAIFSVNFFFHLLFYCYCCWFSVFSVFFSTLFCFFPSNSICRRNISIAWNENQRKTYENESMCVCTFL